MTATKIITNKIQSNLIANVLTSYTNVLTNYTYNDSWSRKTRRCTVPGGVAMNTACMLS